MSLIIETEDIDDLRFHNGTKNKSQGLTISKRF